jgi:hypothetical protein
VVFIFFLSWFEQATRYGEGEAGKVLRDSKASSREATHGFASGEAAAPCFSSGSAPKVRGRLLKCDHDCGSLEILGTLGYYVALVLFLVYFVDEQETLAASNRSRERYQPATVIYAQRFGAFVERFAFDRSSINQQRKTDPEATALAAFTAAIAVLVHSVVASACQSLQFGVLQKFPNPAHNRPRLLGFVFHSIVTQRPHETYAPQHALLNGRPRHECT